MHLCMMPPIDDSVINSILFHLVVDLEGKALGAKPTVCDSSEAEELTFRPPLRRHPSRRMRCCCASARHGRGDRPGAA